MIIIGIDYSINGPAVCVHKGPEWDINNCTIHFMTTVKKNATEYFDGQVIGTHLDVKAEKFMYPQERYFIRTDWVSKIITTNMWFNPHVEEDEATKTHFAIEGYSLNSKGKIDAIIENAATLKALLYIADGIKFTMYPPTTLKKFATGKGNCDKEKMIRQFELETGWKIHDIITPDKQFGTSPVSDIVDAYFVCKKKFEDMGA
jgi:hypothetical protein